MSFRISRSRVIYGPSPILWIAILFGGPSFPWSSHSAYGPNQSVYHNLHIWESFSLASQARSTPLGHVRAHVSTRSDRGQT